MDLFIIITGGAFALLSWVSYGMTRAEKKADEVRTDKIKRYYGGK